MEEPTGLVWGRRAVWEALKSGRSVNKLVVAKGEKSGSLPEILALAKEQRIPTEYHERSRLEKLAPGEKHQGVIAFLPPVSYTELDDILANAKAKGEPPFLLLLDELEDPHNLGAILRTAEAVGVHGVLIPKRRTVPLTGTVAKTSAGAVEYVPVARIGNAVQTLEKLKAQGCWVVGADMDGNQTFYATDLTVPVILVIGSEGRGLSRLVREHCDSLVSLPMIGRINSLNASVAASILMYEVFRQRQR